MEKWNLQMRCGQQRHQVESNAEELFSSQVRCTDAPRTFIILYALSKDNPLSRKIDFWHMPVRAMTFFNHTGKNNFYTRAHCESISHGVFSSAARGSSQFKIVCSPAQRVCWDANKQAARRGRIIKSGEKTPMVWHVLIYTVCYYPASQCWQ